MKRHPAGAGCDGNPRRRLRIAAGETRLRGLSSYLTLPPARKVLSDDARRPSQAFTDRLSADLSSEAAEILISPSGGGPAARGEAAVTSEQSERKRQVVRFAVGAVCCGAVGCRRSDGLLRVETADGSRVLCPAHARWWCR